MDDMERLERVAERWEQYVSDHPGRDDDSRGGGYITGLGLCARQLRETIAQIRSDHGLAGVDGSDQDHVLTREAASNVLSCGCVIVLPVALQAGRAVECVAHGPVYVRASGSAVRLWPGPRQAAEDDSLMGPVL